MRKLLLTLIALSIMNSVTVAQNYGYRYWIDNNAAVVGTGTGQKSFEVDISSLTIGIHALRVQAQNSDNVWSSVRTCYFMKTEVSPSGTTGRYWFDKESTPKTVTTIDGTIELDVSGLKTGIHALHFQVSTAGGVLSHVRTQYFLISDYNAEKRTVKLWIDDNESAAQVLPYTDEDIEIDISSLDYGTHQVTACLYDGSGVIIGRETVSFEYVFTGDIITMGKAKTTYCSDKPLDFGSVSGIDAFVASGFNPQTGTILLMRVKEVPAHTGLLLRGTAGQTYKIPYKETSFYYLNMFKGVLVRTDVPTTSDGYNNYILKDGLFYLSDGTAFVNPNKAYLQMPILSSKTRGIIGYTFDDGTTDVNEAITEDIDNDTNLYNLNGQKIDNPKKGIYIKNGKKIIIH